jgi:uncharacterized protein (TIGR00297 family)
MTSPLFLHPQFYFALVAAAAVAGPGFAFKWLTRSGALATFLVGTVIFWLGGGPGASALLAFFVSSSVLSMLRKAKGGKGASSAKGHARDVWQVLANGGVGAVLVLLHRLLAFHITLDANHNLVLMYLASLAAVNADTWATEIGRLSGVQPRLLSNWRKATNGASGAVSVPGTIASLLGAVFIPLAVKKMFDLSGAELFAIAWAGFLGALMDSILGAGIQGQYRRTDTGEIGDEPEIDGTKALLIRGLPWFNNNLVNLFCSLSGAVFCWLLIAYALRGYN